MKCAFCWDKGLLREAVGICVYDIPHPVCADCKARICDMQCHQVNEIPEDQRLTSDARS